MVSSINEAHERNERTNHEMKNRLRDLKAAETELHTLSMERERMMEEMELMKSRVREMMLEKLSAERKMSEAIARNTRNEVPLPLFSFLTAKQSTIDNWKLRAERAELELGRKERIVQEQQVLISDLKAKRAESDRQRLLLLEKAASPGAISTPLSREEKREEEMELIQLRQVKEILEKELNALKKSLKSQREINAEQLSEIKKLHEEMNVLKKQKDLFQMDLMKQQTSRTEHQLSELRKDISETTLNWEITEQNNQRFQDIAEKYQEMVSREQEKVVLLETQNQLLEERMEMMKQELSIFRSLDIYEATVTSEMRRYHERKSKSRSSPTSPPQFSPLRGKAIEDPVSSDDDDETDFHQRFQLHPSPAASVPSSSFSSSHQLNPTRITWRSEMKGEEESSSSPRQQRQQHQGRYDEELGPQLAMHDMIQSPLPSSHSSLPPRSRFPLSNTSSSSSSAVGTSRSGYTFSSRPAHLFQDSKQLTPSMIKLTGVSSKEDTKQSMSTERVQVRERETISLKPMAAPSLLSRQGLRSGDGRKDFSVGSHRGATGESSSHQPRTLQVGGTPHQGRPSKDEFERAKKLLSKR